MDPIRTGTKGAGGVRGVYVEIDTGQIDRVNAILHAAPDKALTIYDRAIRRGLTAGRTQARKEIRERYDISDASLTEKRTYSTFREAVRRDGSGVVGLIDFAGAKIPLYRFHPSPKTRGYTTRYVNGYGGWRVTTDVSAADVRGQMIRRTTAFIATFPSGHTGIFSRTGGESKTWKDATRELWGFSVKDMLDYGPAREAVQDRMAEQVQKRIDHELLRALFVSIHRYHHPKT